MGKKGDDKTKKPESVPSSPVMQRKAGAGSEHTPIFDMSALEQKLAASQKENHSPLAQLNDMIKSWSATSEAIDGFLKSLERGQVEAIINKRDAQGNTPLYYAVIKQKAGVAEMLLDHGANPMMECGSKHHPIMFRALLDDNEEALEQMVRGGARFSDEFITEHSSAAGTRFMKYHQLLGDKPSLHGNAENVIPESPFQSPLQSPIASPHLGRHRSGTSNDIAEQLSQLLGKLDIKPNNGKGSGKGK